MRAVLAFGISLLTLAVLSADGATVPTEDGYTTMEGISEDPMDITTDDISSTVSTTTVRGTTMYNPWVCYFRIGLWTNMTYLQKECKCWRKNPCVKSKALNFYKRSDDARWKENKDKYYAIIAVYSVAWFIGVSGNTMVIIAVFVYLRKESVTNIFLAGLAFADLLLSLVVLPLHAGTFIIPHWPFGYPLCMILFFIKDWSFAMSVLTLTLIAVERYMAICHPMKAQRVNSPSRSRRLLAIVFFVSVLFGAPNFYMMDVFDRSSNFDTEQYVCGLRRTQDATGKWRVNPNMFRIYTTLIFGVVYSIPTIAMFGSYTSISVTLWKSTKTAKAMQGSGGGDGSNPEREEKMKRETQKRIDVIKMLLTVLAVFFVCWTPFLVYSMNVSWNPQALDLKDSSAVERARDILFALETLAFFNSCLNPLFYAFLSSQFRGVFMAILTCKCKKMEQIMGPSSAASSSVSQTRVSTVPVKEPALPLPELPAAAANGDPKVSL